MYRSSTKPLPFNQNLNGFERVNKALARKLWAWGLPVYVEIKSGAHRITPPDSVPENISPDATGPFRIACVCATDGRAISDKDWTKAVFLVPYGPMGLHLEFENKSNPFVKYGKPIELYYELRAWSFEYSITSRGIGDGHIAYYYLTDKHKPEPLFPVQEEDTAQ